MAEYYIVREEVYWDTGHRQLIRRVVVFGKADPDFWEFLGVADVKFDGQSFTIRFPVKVPEGIAPEDVIDAAFGAFDEAAEAARQETLKTLEERAQKRATPPGKIIVGKGTFFPEVHLDENGVPRESTN